MEELIVSQVTLISIVLQQKHIRQLAISILRQLYISPLATHNCKGISDRLLNHH